MGQDGAEKSSPVLRTDGGNKMRVHHMRFLTAPLRKKASQLSVSRASKVRDGGVKKSALNPLPSFLAPRQRHDGP